MYSKPSPIYSHFSCHLIFIILDDNFVSITELSLYIGLI